MVVSLQQCRSSVRPGVLGRGSMPERRQSQSRASLCAMHVAAAKLLALVVLGLVRLCFALLPVFALAVARPSPRRLDQLMRFGGGVLLATFLLHMLPEAREGIPDAAEAVALVGFFVVYLLEEALHRPQKTPTVAPEAQAPCCATVELDPRKSPAPLTATWSGPR